ncbi:hypothetical protein, partial [uncultured Sphingomonas sp.]|uniref:hypothetical protein n=1 Tax=uncultured Sphingomonas sp. TaxID=158754 RepID=UPI0035CA6A11
NPSESAIALIRKGVSNYAETTELRNREHPLFVPRNVDLQKHVPTRIVESHAGKPAGPPTTARQYRPGSKQAAFSAFLV